MILENNGTWLIVDANSLYYWSVLYSVNRATDNEFLVLWRALEEPELFPRQFSQDWEYAHDESRMKHWSEHRDLAKSLYAQQILGIL